MSDFRFEPAQYGPVVITFLRDERLAALGPGTPDPKVYHALRGFNPETDLGKSARNLAAARACHSGLWLYFDYLDESHAISQDLNTPDGSFWHAIMHRREPDAWNSNYWWHKVGQHPVLNRLAELAPALGYSYTSPQDFVDFCERVRGSESLEEKIAKRVQLLEWQLLFDHCYQKALR